MLEIYEKVYFSEIDRKSKIQAALAFPIGTSAFGVTTASKAFQEANLDTSCGWIPLTPLIPSAISFAIFLFFIGKFLNSGSYQYLWTMNEFKAHYEGLAEFSQRFPDAPPGDATFEEHLKSDLANCATQNALLNDKRSEILHNANLCSFVLVLFSLLSAAIVMVENRLG